MRSGYLDIKYMNMNEHITFMSWNMLLCCMIIPLVIFCVGCVKSKWSNRISKYSQKNVKEWLFIYDMLLAKIVSGSFFIYHSISAVQKKLCLRGKTVSAYMK